MSERSSLKQKQGKRVSWLWNKAKDLFIVYGYNGLAGESNIV